MKKFFACLIVSAFLLCPVGGVPTQSADTVSISFIKLAEAKKSYRGEYQKPRFKKGAHKSAYGKPSHKPKYKKVKVKGYRTKKGHYVRPHTRHVRVR